MGVKRLAAFGAIGVVALAIAGSVVMASDQQNNVVTLAKTEVVNHDYFARGGTIEVSGTVNGDVYAAGGQIIIDGTVNGDVLAAGGTIDISGQVNGNVRAASGQVNISGVVARNVTIGGGNVRIDKSGVVMGNAVIGAGTLIISGPVRGSIKAGGGTVTVTSQVGGDADVASRQLAVSSGAEIGGHLTYWSRSNAVLDPSARVGGGVTHNQPAPSRESRMAGNMRVWAWLYWLAVILVLGMALLWLAPNHTRLIVKTIERRPWASLGAGFAGLILVPLAAIVLLATLIGAPIGIITGALYAIAVFLAPIWIVLVVGDLIARGLKVANSGYIVLLIGAVVYAVISLVPILGPLVSFFGLLFGLGGSLLAGSQLFGKLRGEALI